MESTEEKKPVKPEIILGAINTVVSEIGNVLDDLHAKGLVYDGAPVRVAKKSLLLYPPNLCPATVYVEATECHSSFDYCVVFTDWAKVTEVLGIEEEVD